MPTAQAIRDEIGSYLRGDISARDLNRTLGRHTAALPTETQETTRLYGRARSLLAEVARNDRSEISLMDELTVLLRDTSRTQVGAAAIVTPTPVH